MDIIKCEALINAAEMGSITAAAEEMGYTQSGITRMISSLEDEVGFTLLTRSKHGVTLTGDGEIIIQKIRELVRAYQGVIQTASDINGVIEGVLRIGSYFSFSSAILPGILKKFEDKYPKVNVRLQEGPGVELNRWLFEKSVDLCFMSKPDDKIECDYLPLFKDEILAWLPKSHPKAKAKAFPVKDLENEAFIQTMPNLGSDIDRLIAEENLKLNVMYTTRNSYSTYNMVEKGIGISVEQKLTSENWKGNVVKIPLRPKKYIPIGIAVPSRYAISPAAKKFIELAREDLAP